MLLFQQLQTSRQLRHTIKRADENEMTSLLEALLLKTSETMYEEEDLEENTAEEAFLDMVDYDDVEEADDGVEAWIQAMDKAGANWLETLEESLVAEGYLKSDMNSAEASLEAKLKGKCQ